MSNLTFTTNNTAGMGCRFAAVIAVAGRGRWFITATSGQEVRETGG